jgi:CRP-like cAMP-binding protein
MAIATATLDFDSYGKLMRPALPVEVPGLEALRTCPQLQRAPIEALRGLARDATLRSLNRGVTLATQGGRLDTAILVVRGKIRAVCRAVNGREISVEMFRAGDLIADGALAPETPLANDWEAVEASTLLLIPRDAFLACLRATPELTLALGAELVARLERSKQLATGLALAGVQERVVSRLVAIGRQDGTAGPKPPDPAGAGQSDWRLPRDGLPHRFGAGPSGAAHAARAVLAGQQAAGRKRHVGAGERRSVPGRLDYRLRKR